MVVAYRDTKSALIIQFGALSLTPSSLTRVQASSACLHTRCSLDVSIARLHRNLEHGKIWRCVRAGSVVERSVHCTGCTHIHTNTHTTTLQIRVSVFLPMPAMMCGCRILVCAARVCVRTLDNVCRSLGLRASPTDEIFASFVREMCACVGVEVLLNGLQESVAQLL